MQLKLHVDIYPLASRSG